MRLFRSLGLAILAILAVTSPSPSRGRQNIDFAAGLLGSIRETGSGPQTYSLPLYFEPNLGQADSQARFVARGRGGILLLGAARAAFAIRVQDDRRVRLLRMQWVGADPDASTMASDPLPGRSHYFRGSDPGRWVRNVPHVSRVRFDDVYPGTDLAYYGRDGRLEYDLILAPGADPGMPRLRFEGADGLSIDAGGDLRINVGGEIATFRAPMIYQEARGGRVTVSGRYVLAGPLEIGFEVPAYDRSLALVIDPVFEYSTHLGGSYNDAGGSVAVNSSGEAYVFGVTASTYDFPLVAPLQPNPGRIITYFHDPDRDCFVTKFSADGRTLLFSTYLSSGGHDYSGRIALDGAGNAYVTGMSSADDFPLRDPIQSRRGGGQDAFVAALSSDGSRLLFSTFWGGAGNDFGYGIAADPTGGCWLTGWTSSPDFPGVRASQSRPAGGVDAILVKVATGGSAIESSSCLGGTGDDYGIDLTLDHLGRPTVTGYTISPDFPTSRALQAAPGGGWDAFVTRFAADGSMLDVSTYLGGSGDDIGYGVRADGFDRLVIAGSTTSLNFPTERPLQPLYGGGNGDIYFARLNSDGTALDYSTYVGGEAYEAAYALALDRFGNPFVTGRAAWSLTQIDPAQPKYGGALYDAYALKLAADGGAIRYSTYIGGGWNDAGFGIAVDDAGNAYVTGETRWAPDFPVVNAFQPVNAGGGDAFLTKLGARDTTPPVIDSLTADFSLLWPPNHKLVPVTLSVVAHDDQDPAPASRIVSVSSNQPENGTGDGDTAPDWEITGDLTLNLRAERSDNGASRIYTITIACTDASGNTAYGTVNVQVLPQSLRR